MFKERQFLKERQVTIKDEEDAPTENGRPVNLIPLGTKVFWEAVESIISSFNSFLRFYFTLEGERS